MSVIDTLVTDRAKSDTDRWATLRGKGFANMTAAEQAEWLAEMKGAYNYTDLNRVGEAMNYVASRFETYGYMADVTARTNWAISDKPSNEDLTKYLCDLCILRGILSVMQSTPPVPDSMEDLTYQEANDIERILEVVDDTLTRTIFAFRHSNTTISGMGGLIR